VRHVAIRHHPQHHAPLHDVQDAVYRVTSVQQYSAC
jgi:hypothetical protein